MIGAHSHRTQDQDKTHECQNYNKVDLFLILFRELAQLRRDTLAGSCCITGLHHQFSLRENHSLAQVSIELVADVMVGFYLRDSFVGGAGAAQIGAECAHSEAMRGGR